jgi:hypothetical protein
MGLLCRRPPSGPISTNTYPVAEGYGCEDWDIPRGLSTREGYICEALKSSRDLPVK